MQDDKCVCCGEYVPDGRQVCCGCENTYIKFKNGSIIKSIGNSTNTVRSRKKSFEQMKWILGDMYKSLKWYQKLCIWFDYKFYKLKFWR